MENSIETSCRRKRRCNKKCIYKSQKLRELTYLFKKSNNHKMSPQFQIAFPLGQPHEGLKNPCSSIKEMTNKKIKMDVNNQKKYYYYRILLVNSLTLIKNSILITVQQQLNDYFHTFSNTSTNVKQNEILGSVLPGYENKNASHIIHQFQFGNYGQRSLDSKANTLIFKHEPRSARLCWFHKNMKAKHKGLRNQELNSKLQVHFENPSVTIKIDCFGVIEKICKNKFENIEKANSSCLRQHAINLESFLSESSSHSKWQQIERNKNTDVNQADTSHHKFTSNTIEWKIHIFSGTKLLAGLLQKDEGILITEQHHQINSDTRSLVAEEIYLNEQSYVASLETIVLRYLNVLKYGNMLELKTVEEIFFMIPEILEIHEKFLTKLRRRLEFWVPNQKVGDAFLEVFSKDEVLNAYTSFIKNCNTAKNAIKTAKLSSPSFAKFLETNAREHRGKLTLENLLIKPIQKFPNYEMLFRRLLKHTGKGHPDLLHIQAVLRLVHGILFHLNAKGKENLENYQREATLRELERIIEGLTDLNVPNRYFISFDLVWITTSQSTRKERGIFLFSDILLITSVKKKCAAVVRNPDNAFYPASIGNNSLDSTKYKFLIKVSLANIENIKARKGDFHRDSDVLKQLIHDSIKLRQITNMSASIQYPHQMLEEVIRKLDLDIREQLFEHRSNDLHLNTIDIVARTANGSQHLEIIFRNAEKCSHWKEAFNEARQKLAAAVDQQFVPEFITYMPIVSSKPGMQLTCAAPTSNLNELWICICDEYVGYIYILSMSPKPYVSSCHQVCKTRILCLTAVPPRLKSKSDDYQEENSTDKDLICSARSLNQNNHSTMWLGAEDGAVRVYSYNHGRWQDKQMFLIQLTSPVSSILYIDNKVFVSLSNGEIFVYFRKGVDWIITSPYCLSVGTFSTPVTKLLFVAGKIWCAVQRIVKILDSANLQVINQILVSPHSKAITNMITSFKTVWVSVEDSAFIKCYHANKYILLYEVNLGPAINKILSRSDDIIRQHKASCLRVTALLSCEDLIWIGTSAGALLTVPIHEPMIEKVLVAPSGLPFGHTGHVKFLSFVEIPFTQGRESGLNVHKENQKNKEQFNAKNQKRKLVVSGGLGFENFRSYESSSSSHSTGQKDNTNHLLLWQI